MNIAQYGYVQWGSLFNSRQAHWLQVCIEELRRLFEEIDKNHQDAGLREAIKTIIALSVSNTVQYNSNMSTWLSDGMISVFIQSSSIPMRADYAEANPIMKRLVGGISYQFERVIDVLNEFCNQLHPAGTAMWASATQQILPDESIDVIATDPPYYVAIPYAELSDFFYVWIRRFLGEVHQHILATETTPKAEEAIQNLPHSKAVGQKDRAHFERKIYESLVACRAEMKPDGVGLIVFAHAETEGWEALVKSMLSAGWVVTASWPIDTERKGRMLASRQRVLSASIHLICRPRAKDAGIGDWGYVIQNLGPRVREWMKRLEQEGIRGADLVFACIGPALEIFSRYLRVETAEGDEVALETYLERVWEVVGRTALENILGTAEGRGGNGQTGVLEEDARLTALFLWTLQSTEGMGENGTREDVDPQGNGSASAKGLALPFDVVRRFAQPMGINLDTWTDRIIGPGEGRGTAPSDFATVARTLRRRGGERGSRVD